MTQPPAPQSTRVFAEHFVTYAQAGWPCILPVPPATKTPPPTGFTGAEGRDTDPITLVNWATVHPEYPGYSIALRMPEGVIGIDVDCYAKTSSLPDGSTKTVQKMGEQTLTHFEAEWGALPSTWTSTARGPGQPSRIHLFRVPAQRYATKLDTGLTSDIEIIQRHHRYAVVAPSLHPAAGSSYAWYDPAGNCSATPPRAEDLTELPAAWVAGLASGATVAGPASADRNAGMSMLDQLLEDWRPECAEITSARQIAEDELRRADAGSRHDTMTARAHHLVQIAAQGHTGVAWAINELRGAWGELTAGEGREDEFERMLLTSARKAVTTVGGAQIPRDPCLMAYAVEVPGPTPGTEAGEPGEPIEPPRWWSVREVIGAHAFDPNAGLDQSLAERVLERTFPTLRYAYDSGGWLLRAPRVWELHKDLSEWAVAQVAPLMPVGDPTADKESEAFSRHQRRTRLMSTAGSRAISGKMGALVAGGMHPAAVRLANLDAEPEILWAGGLPWSLRNSCAETGLALAPIDPATPHLQSAGTTPALQETPLWDAFLEALWPDEEIRAWALRVLSITLTGYADRALPILLGDTGRGKTQVIALLMSVLGSYAHAADARLMTPGGENAHASIVFALKGRRLSFIDEGPREGRVAQERLKQLTGGGELTANQMNQNPITFAPTHTLVLTTNDEPPLVDPAIRSRARVIPCDGDPDLVRAARAAIGHVGSNVWKAEAPGVLGKMILEAGAWLRDPSTADVLAAPESIRFMAERMGAEQDPVGVWLNEETEHFEPGTPSRELYQAFTSSCLRNNMRKDAVPSETKWGKALTRFGFAAEHTRQGKMRRLKVRSGGFLPGMTPGAPSGISAPAPENFSGAPEISAPAPKIPAPLAGPVTGCDGLVTGSEPNPSHAFSQVNPCVAPVGDGCDGLNQFSTYTRTGAPAHAHGPENGSNPSHEAPVHNETQGLTCENAETTPTSQPVTPPAPTPKARSARAKTPEEKSEAKTRAAQAREDKRLAAVAEAGGATVPLPALLLRDGTVGATSPEHADALLRTITDGDGILAVDVEHTGYPVGHENYVLRTVQLGNENFALILDPAQPDQADVAGKHLAAASVLHAHSATADLVPLAAAGLIDTDAAWSKMIDTGLLAKLSDPASTGNDSDLKNLSKNVLGASALSHAADVDRKALFKAGKWLTDTEVTTPLARSGWAQADPASTTMVRYAGSDVIDAAALAKTLPRPEAAVLERERAAQRMTARVSHRGIRIDGEQVERLLLEHRSARTQHGETVQAFGIENPGSNAQVAAALGDLGAPLPRTPSGNLSVAKGVLEPMKAAEGQVGELVRAVLDYRHHNTALSLLLEPYWDMYSRGDGRARPTIYTLGADTGRMSSSRPNVQQVSREGGMRACFTADPGQLMISADFSGVEIRVAAALSQDPALMQMLSDGVDLHGEIAKLVWGPEATKAHRYKAKPMVFGRIYGSGIDGLARSNAVDHHTAKAVINAMDALTPGLTEWSRMVSDGVQSGRTQFQSYAGRIIHMPKEASHAAPNYCIQGTARELLVDAMLRWSKTKWGQATLFPVHDELVVMVPEDEAAEATAALTECMTTEIGGVQIVAEASEPSFAWADSV